MRILLPAICVLNYFYCQAQLPDLPNYYVELCGVLKIENEIEKNESYLYRWRFPNGEIIYGESIHHCFQDTGKQEVTLEWVLLSDQNTVLGAKPVTVILSKIFELSSKIEIDRQRNLTASPQLFFEQEPFNVSYTWSTGDGIYKEGDEFQHDYKNPGEYTIQVMAKIEYQDRIIMLSSRSDIQID